MGGIKSNSVALGPACTRTTSVKFCFPVTTYFEGYDEDGLRSIKKCLQIGATVSKRHIPVKMDVGMLVLALRVN